MVHGGCNLLLTVSKAHTSSILSVGSHGGVVSPCDQRDFKACRRKTETGINLLCCVDWTPRVSRHNQCSGISRTALNRGHLRIAMEGGNPPGLCGQSLNMVPAVEVGKRGLLPGDNGKFRVKSQSAPDAQLDLHGSSVVTQLSEGSAFRVAVDVDEVLGSFLATLNIFCAEEYSSKHDLSEFYVYDFRKVWNCSQAEANHRVHAFFDSDIFHSGIPPIPGAGEALERLANVCHLEVVTSRQHVIQQPTLDWIERHYPGIFKNVHFGNHFALQGEAKPKSEICKSVGAELLIDDNPRYAVECAEHGISVLLFDWELSYPWSKTDDGPVHPLITRVANWKEVETAVLSHIQRKRS